MTMEKLHVVVRKLANACWVRYWVHWNYPVESPWLMGFSARDAAGKDLQVADAPQLGFLAQQQDGRLVYLIRRTNEDGTPFGPPQPSVQPGSPPEPSP